MNAGKNKILLGIFVLGGLLILVVVIFLIGKQKHMFTDLYKLSTTFNNVSGLQVGNNVRFSGINIGTVDNVVITNDSTVRVDMLIDKSVQKFIKTDSEVMIGAEGIIGDKVLNITQGSNSESYAKPNQLLASTEPVETDAIMASLQITADNAAVLTYELSNMISKINNGRGLLGRLINDQSIAKNVDQTLENLKESSQGLSENMEAAKHNFLLKGYFKKKEKEALKKKQQQEEIKKEKEKEKDKKK